jgi:predicted O-methyltransferase YrrM
MSGEVSIFELFPELRSLRGKVPDDVIERELRPKAARFAQLSQAARKRIPIVLLSEVLPAEAERAPVRMQRFLGQWGNVSVEEVCKLALICSWQQPRAVFEIGTYNGMTTLQLALNSSAESVVYTLDVTPGSPETAKLEVGGIDGFLAQKMGAFKVRVGEYFQGHPAAGKIRQFLGDSLAFDFSPYRNAIDLVFIDAGHTYRYVKSDTENALRMIRPGGTILWHDYMQVLHPDVTGCLLECVERGMDIRQLKGTHLAIYRQP